MTGLKGKLFSVEICGIHLLVNIKDKCVLEENVKVIVVIVTEMQYNL